jgi:hypothetical protein
MLLFRDLSLLTKDETERRHYRCFFSHSALLDGQSCSDVCDTAKAVPYRKFPVPSVFLAHLRTLLDLQNNLHLVGGHLAPLGKYLPKRLGDSNLLEVLLYPDRLGEFGLVKVSLLDRQLAEYQFCFVGNALAPFMALPLYLLWRKSQDIRFFAEGWLGTS